MCENLNSESLLLEEEENSSVLIRANQSNYTSSIEDFNYTHSSLVFSNINSTF